MNSLLVWVNKYYLAGLDYASLVNIDEIKKLV